MKRAFSVLVCAAMIFSLTACGEDPVSDGKDAPEGDAAASGKLAVITGTGGLGDQNLNDYVYSGVKMHEAEGVTVDVVQPSDLADFPNLQTLYAEEGTYSTIVCIGFDQKEALTTVSKEFPDQSFIICDTECEGSNVTSVVFRAEETGFQLGVLAGLLVREGALENSRGNNTIGFVGGSDIATINQFAAGY